VCECVSLLHSVANCRRVFRCVAVCCSVLQFVAACCGLSISETQSMWQWAWADLCECVSPIFQLRKRQSVVDSSQLAV